MKKLISIFMIIVLVFSLGACVRDVEKPTPNPPVVEDPTPSTEIVTLYFSNNEYLMTGNEELDKFIAEEKEIETDNTTLEEAIVRELMKDPKDTDKLRTSIPSTAKLLDVEVNDGIAYVNFAQDGLNGGSLEESMTIGQIVNSLGELDSVDKVQFLIDGQEGESLMGHIDISEPIEATKAE